MATVRTRVAALVAASAVAASGCGIHTTSARESTDVAGTAYAVSDGRVTTPCFAFDLPAAGDYLVVPESEGCTAAINVPHGDILTVVHVRAQIGGFDSDWLAAKTSNFDVIEPVERVQVGGAEAQRVVVEDGFGLPMTMLYLPLPQGRFAHDGEPLSSVLIAAHTGAPELRQAFDDVVASFHILD